MTVEGGVAAVYTTLDENLPSIGIPGQGTSNASSHGDHIHPLLLPIGVYVSGGIPQLESTSTLCYIWVPVGAYLTWDTSLELFGYDS